MVMANKYGISAAPITPQMFGNAGVEHMEKYGTTHCRVQSCQYMIIRKANSQLKAIYHYNIIVGNVVFVILMM